MAFVLFCSRSSGQGQSLDRQVWVGLLTCRHPEYGDGYSAVMAATLAVEQLRRVAWWESHAKTRGFPHQKFWRGFASMNV